MKVTAWIGLFAVICVLANQPALADDGCNCHSNGLSVISFCQLEQHVLFSSVDGGLDSIKVYQMLGSTYTKHWCICMDSGEGGLKNCTYFSRVYDGDGPDVEFLESANCAWWPGGPSSATCHNNGVYPPCSAPTGVPPNP